MSEQLQLRRGTSTQVAAFTGAQGETVMDTTNNRLVVNDGTTVGGWPAAKLSEVQTNSRTGVSDAAYAVLTTDRMVAYTALTAARVVEPARREFVPNRDTAHHRRRDWKLHVDRLNHRDAERRRRRQWRQWFGCSKYGLRLHHARKQRFRLDDHQPRVWGRHEAHRRIRAWRQYPGGGSRVAQSGLSEHRSPVRRRSRRTASCSPSASA